MIGIDIGYQLLGCGGVPPPHDPAPEACSQRERLGIALPGQGALRSLSATSIEKMLPKDSPSFRACEAREGIFFFLFWE
jgi:hypothetical protein